MNQDNATIGPLMRVDLELRAVPPGIAEKEVEISSLEVKIKAALCFEETCRKGISFCPFP